MGAIATRAGQGGGGRVVASLCLALLTGCVGSLDNPERFGDGSFCPPEVDVPQLFEERCGGAICHGAGAEPAGGLDLESPGVAERLVDVPSEECGGRLRVSALNPDASFFLDKLTGPPPGCGERMPFVGYLTEHEVTCVRLWIGALPGVGASGAVGSDGGAP